MLPKLTSMSSLFQIWLCLTCEIKLDFPVLFESYFYLHIGYGWHGSNLPHDSKALMMLLPSLKPKDGVPMSNLLTGTKYSMLYSWTYQPRYVQWKQ
jgi:hypothetical protein